MGKYAKYEEFARVKLRRDMTYARLYASDYGITAPAGPLPTSQDLLTIVDVHDVDPPGYEVEFFDPDRGFLDLYTLREHEIELVE